MRRCWERRERRWSRLSASGAKGHPVSDRSLDYQWESIDAPKVTNAIFPLLRAGDPRIKWAFKQICRANSGKTAVLPACHAEEHGPYELRRAFVVPRWGPREAVRWPGLPGWQDIGSDCCAPSYLRHFSCVRQGR